MKTICIFSVVLAAFVMPSFAAPPLSPEDVVRGAIEAARYDSLSVFVGYCDIPAIAGRARHPMTAVALIEFLKDMKEDDVKFEPVVAEKDTNRVTLRMIEPKQADFELAKWKETKGRDWKIVGVHP